MKCIIENIDRNKSMCYTCSEIEVGGKSGMAVTELCKDLIARGNLQYKDVATKMGWSAQSMSNKFRRNSLSADEFIKLLEVLGYEMKIVETDSNKEMYMRRKGVGERIKMMVNGIKYDTFKADAICHSDETEDIFYELYKDTEGRYFVAHYAKWEGGVNYISPIGEEDAQRLITKTQGY